MVEMETNHIGSERAQTPPRIAEEIDAGVAQGLAVKVRVHQENPGINAGQEHNKYAQVGADLRAHAEMSHFRIIVIIEAVGVMIVLVRVVTAGMRIVVSMRGAGL